MSRHYQFYGIEVGGFPLGYVHAIGKKKASWSWVHIWDSKFSKFLTNDG